MSRLHGWRHIARSFFGRSRADRETREELEYHLSRQTEKHMAEGMSAHEARRRAAVELGGVERGREETAVPRRGTVIIDFLGDARYAARGLVARPGFAIAALLTLAI